MIDLSFDFLLTIVALAKEAGDAVMPIYLRPRQAIDSSLKQDGSPLTEADILANSLILEGLARLTPHLPCLSEEACDIPYAKRSLWDSYWLIDPIDGTKEFLAQNGDFTVNIALVKNHQVVLGVVYAPATGVCYYAAKGLGAYKQTTELSRLSVRSLNANQPLTIAVSRRHGQADYQRLLAQFPQHQFCQRGSSLKFCLIAEGVVDLYPRLAPTSEWDTAAAQCVLEQAGGCVTDLMGRHLSYNSRDSLLNPHFIAFGDASIAWISFFSHE